MSARNGLPTALSTAGTCASNGAAGDLTRSVRAAGLRMGLYHSIFEWFHPLFLEDKANGFRTRRYVDEVYFPEALEINRRYKPDLIWSDGDWNANSSVWRSPELLAWLYNEAPNCRDVLVNDRWGSDNPPIGSGRHFGGYFSGADRQQADPKLLRHKWENAFTIDAASWGYSRKSNIGDYLSVRDMLHQVALVSSPAAPQPPSLPPRQRQGLSGRLSRFCRTPLDASSSSRPKMSQWGTNCSGDGSGMRRRKQRTVMQRGRRPVGA